MNGLMNINAYEHSYSEVFVCAGGPHAHFAADWNATAAALTKLGFAVLMGEPPNVSLVPVTT